MTTTTSYGAFRSGLLLALVLAPLAAPASARESSGMTAPPWGDAGARITFGDEDEGLLQIQYKGQFRATFRDLGSGADGDGTTSNLGFRRNRLAFTGAWRDKVSLYVQTEFVEDPNVETVSVADYNLGTGFQFLDAVVRFNLAPALKLNVGKFKFSFSREGLEDCLAFLTLDRSLFLRPPYVTTRDEGVALWGNLFDERVQYRVEAMEGRKAVSGLTAPSSSFRYGARAHVTLLDSEAGYGYKGTYLGAKRVLTFGGAVQYEPDVAYVDPANRLGEEDYTGWTVDGYFEYPLEAVGTVTASAAYEKVDLGDATLGADPDVGVIGLFGQKSGWFAAAGYLLPGTPLQVFGRYERWRFARLLSVFDQTVDWYGVGANYYVWGQSLKLTAEWSRTDFGIEGTFTGVDGKSRTSKDFDTLVVQMQFAF